MRSRLSRFRPLAVVILFFFVHELAFGQQAQIRSLADLELLEPDASTYAKVDERLAYYVDRVHSYEDAWAVLKPPVQEFVLASLHSLEERNRTTATFWQMTRNWFQRKTAVAKGVCLPLVRFGTEKLLEYNSSLPEEASEMVADRVAGVIVDRAPMVAMEQATACLEAGLVASAERFLPAFKKLHVDRQGREIRVNGEPFFTIHRVSGREFALGYKDTEMGIVVGGDVDSSLLQLPGFIEEIKKIEDDAEESIVQKILGIETAHAHIIEGLGIFLFVLILGIVTALPAIVGVVDAYHSYTFVRERFPDRDKFKTQMALLAVREDLDNQARSEKMNTLFIDYVADLEEVMLLHVSGSLLIWNLLDLLKTVQTIWQHHHRWLDDSAKIWVGFLRNVASDPRFDWIRASDPRGQRMLEQEIDNMIEQVAAIEMARAKARWSILLTQKFGAFKSSGGALPREADAEQLNRQFLSAIQDASDNIEREFYGYSAHHFAKEYAAELVSVWEANPTLFDEVSGQWLVTKLTQWSVSNVNQLLQNMYDHDSCDDYLRVRVLNEIKGGSIVMPACSRVWTTVCLSVVAFSLFIVAQANAQGQAFQAALPGTLSVLEIWFSSPDEAPDCFIDGVAMHRAVVTLELDHQEMLLGVSLAATGEPQRLPIFVADHLYRDRLTTVNLNVRDSADSFEPLEQQFTIPNPTRSFYDSYKPLTLADNLGSSCFQARQVSLAKPHAVGDRPSLVGLSFFKTKDLLLLSRPSGLPATAGTVIGEAAKKFLLVVKADGSFVPAALKKSETVGGGLVLVASSLLPSNNSSGKKSAASISTNNSEPSSTSKPSNHPYENRTIYTFGNCPYIWRNYNRETGGNDIYSYPPDPADHFYEDGGQVCIHPTRPE